jgi:hypothetical protein
MRNPLIDTAQALDAAIAANRLARRDKLTRAVRNQRIRTRVAFALTGCIAIFGLAFSFAGDHEADAVIAMIASVTFGVVYIGGKTGHRKAVDSLHEMDQSI